MVLKWLNCSAMSNWSLNWTATECHIKILGNVSLLHLVKEVTMLGRGFCLWLSIQLLSTGRCSPAPVFLIINENYHLAHCLGPGQTSLHDQMSPIVVWQCGVLKPLVGMG